MPIHDIIDNRTEKLVDHLAQMLGSSEQACFAGGDLLYGLTAEEIAIVESASREATQTKGGGFK